MFASLLALLSLSRRVVTSVENRLEFEHGGSITFSGRTINYQASGRFVESTPDGVTASQPSIADAELWFLTLLETAGNETFAVTLPTPVDGKPYYLVSVATS